MADDKQGLGARLKARLARARKRWPFVDHLLRMQEHYSVVEGNLLAGAVTYFGFLSFFPILALGFAVIGYVSIAYPDARDSMVTAIEQIFPGIVSSSDEPGRISLSQIESAKATAGIIGFVGVLYSGLGWLSGLQVALRAVFMVPDSEKPNFFKGKAIDLVVLALLGVVLIVSVGVAGVAKGLTGTIVDAVNLSGSWVGSPLVWLIGITLGLAARTLFFYVMFRLLGEPPVSSRSLWLGAFFAAFGFEILKLLVVNVLGGVGGSAFAPLAIAITLIVWINYFSRLTIYGACWAHTAEASTAEPSTSSQVAAAERDAVLVPADVIHDRDEARARGRLDPGSVVVGAAAGAAAAMLLGRAKR